MTPTSNSSPIKSIPQLSSSYDDKISEWMITSATSAYANLLPVPASFSVLTWNIDFSHDLPDRRLESILTHLESVLSPKPTLDTVSQQLPIILFQEMSESCFGTLLSHPFVRDLYHSTDTSSSAWENHYGTVTLIPKHMASRLSVFRTPFPGSRMGRDALCVDLKFAQTGYQPDFTLRIVNTHLESLRGHGDFERPNQLQSISRLLVSSGTHGGIVGGDMNAIAPSDFGLPEMLGLSDAWVVSTHNRKFSGSAFTIPRTSDWSTIAEAEGHTWGYQPRSRYPPQRLDKILSTGALEVQDVTRIGIGLEYQNNERSKVKGHNWKSWASDHYGLLATFKIIDTKDVYL